MRSIATFDLTHRCPLHCAHCYVASDRVEGGAQLDEPSYLAGLSALRQRHGIRSALWVGGEPLMRLPLLRKAMRLFPRNAVVTSGAVPIPDDLGVPVLLSIDGPKSLHEQLRGPGSYQRAWRHSREQQRRGLALMVTLTAATVKAIDALPQVVEEFGAAGALVGFFVGPRDDALRLDGEARNRAVDKLHCVLERHPGVVLNTPALLEWFRPRRGAEWSAGCLYREGALAFDPLLRVKKPCTFGANHDCEACGCPLIAAQLARAHGDMASETLLRVLFDAPVRGASAA